MSRLLDPRFNLVVGATITVAAIVWTLLAILLTSEPPNVIAMSGLALVLAGLALVQGSLQMRKVEVETSGDVAVGHADQVNAS